MIRTTEGKGIVAVLVGGEEPHIGAIAVGLPRSISHHPEKIRSTTSVFTFPGHLDDRVAVPSATELAEKLREPVVVVSGIHVYHATTDDIDKLVSNSRKIIEKATKR
ncbi:MAG: hypothetical protein OEX77_06435 [Candidatus Bathyarchaeota archaeon]|nr:hypothetical protein [Candidatus Bathyarchaeota archaeon]MDH5733796.1 hypothetical protein [Candidatus Bathyarchaeota archaeon]